MKTPDELVEEGVGLIAKGLMRAKEQRGPQEARQMCESAKNVLGGMWSDFYRMEVKLKDEKNAKKTPESSPEAGPSS